MRGVKGGVLGVGRGLYGMSLKEKKEIGVYDGEVEGYEVLEGEGSLVGVV